MKYIEAPDEEAIWPSVFLAGGITGCPDWQKELCEFLEEYCPNIVVINPRRNEWNINDNAASGEQIRWEYIMLKKADLVSFWFPKETLCPIALFELGAHLHRNPVIGTDFGYKRAFDVREQVTLELGPLVEIAKSIEDLGWQITHRVQDL